MFRSLRIKNLALVDDITWDLGTGFNILTGETGAGKSLLIGAVQLLIGERADKGMIRSGTDSCIVEAEFEIRGEGLHAQLASFIKNAGVEPCEDRVLILKRMISASGINRQFVNGSAVPLQLLKKIGEWIVDIHGPHDHQSLLSNTTQLELLDAFAKLKKERSVLKDRYAAWKQTQKKLAENQLTQEQLSQKIELLRSQIDEIHGAAIKQGEEEKLETEFRIATHAKQILECAHEIHRILDGNEVSVIQQLSRIEKLIRQWLTMDPSAEVILEKNHLAIEAINQLLNILTKRLEEPQMDPEKLHKLELRMDLFQRLKRKYGKSINDLESVATKAEEELCRLEHIEETLSALKKEMEVSYTEAKKIADQLHLKRIEAAKELSHSVENELRELGFLQAMFKVCINTSDELESTGFDRVEFMFAPNPGEAARPLKMIASSGEMARVMLAIKTTLASVDEVPVLIFDEIDANVGGTTATKVGAKLQNLGKWHQVICITHLPQVAAFGDRHYLVEKHLNDERTFTRLRLLSDQERRAEIARMLGGKHQEALALANKLIREAAKNEAMLFSE